MSDAFPEPHVRKVGWSRGKAGQLLYMAMLMVLVAPVQQLLAHEKFTIVGSVVALTKDEIAVKAVDGATYEIDMQDSTVVTDRTHKKIDRGNLKVAARVVVLALGHDMFDLEAFEIQLVDK